jgi:hypothetical protein
VTARTVGIEVPADFPAAGYNEFAEKIGPLQPKHPKAYRHYAGGWNAVAYRFTSATEYDEEFAKSIGMASSPIERYIQERALFGFFMSAVAVLDGAGYALYAVAHMIRPADFSLADPHRIKLSSVAEDFNKHFAPERIASALKDSCDNHEMRQMREIRNVLAHRAATLRDYTSSSPTATWDLQYHLPASGAGKVKVDRAITGDMRTALSVQLGVIVDAACAFVRTHF